MSQILDELGIKKPSSLGRVSIYSLLIGATIVFGIYVGNLFFGSRSVSVLLNLQKQKESLSQEVQRYQEMNSALQKEYFELMGLDPDNKTESKK